MKKRLLLLLGLCCSLSLAFAQGTVTVRGKVTDAATKESIPGVSVRVKGGTTGVATGIDGSYSIQVPSDGTLVFNSIGFDTQEIAVGGKTVVDVTLIASSTQLEQVVVVGYGTQRKRDVTGSITTVKGDDIAKMPATNPIASLQGKVAGLTVVNSGRAGSSPTVRIRGVNSTNNSDPLYVVDGVYQTNIDFLNPADIESIEVLRDPSSIAIFGLQGGNGVIIVTTKRAEKGQTRVSFQNSLSLQHVTNQIDVVDAAGFKKLYSAQLANLGAAPFDFANYTADTHWQDLILRDAFQSNNSLSISNSGEKTTTLLNLGYNNQQGVLRNDKFQKFMGRMNEEIRINDAIKVTADLTGFHYVGNVPAADLNNALWAAPIVGIQAGPSTYYSMPSFQRAQVGNPVARLNNGDRTSINKGYRVIGNLSGEVKFLQNFTWKSAVYTDLGFGNSRSYTPLPFTYINLGEGAAATTTTFDNTARTSVSQNQAEYRKYQLDHTLTFDKAIGKHKVTALAGFTTLFQGSTSISGTRRDTTLNIPRDADYWYLGVAQASNPGNFGGGGGQESYMSFLGRVNYAFASKYLVNATYRRDGNSKFSPSNRWGDFGSVGLGWVVSEESFFKSLEAINFLKIRGAWGTVGSALGTGTNLYQPGLNSSNVAIFGSNVYTSVTPAYVPDPNLHWEVVRGIDAGFETRMLQNRLSIDATWYDRKTKDILTFLTLPGTAGSYSYYTNLGSISNRGIELSLGWEDKIGELTYSFKPNYSFNKNNVESIGNNISFQLLGNNGVNKTETGQSIGYFYGYRQIGVYQSTAQLDKQAHFSNSLPGDIAYEDINNDGVIDSKDRTYLGTPFPKHNFGLNLSLGYKGFDMVLEGQGVAGNKVYTQRRTQTFATLNYETNRLNAWSGAGSTNIEPILDNTRGNNFLFSNYFLEDGDYFRLRTIQLGYTFSPAALSKLKVRQLRMYVSGQNIKTWSKTTGYTPEASLGSPIASGADNGLYPVPAVYTFGLNVTL